MSIVTNSSTRDEPPQRFLALVSVPYGAPGITAMPNELVTDNALSFDARGLLAYLCSFPDAVTFAEMVAATSDGPHTTRRALDELIARDLVTVVER